MKGWTEIIRDAILTCNKKLIRVSIIYNMEPNNQKVGKPIWILLKQERVIGSGFCTSLLTDNHTSTPPLSFLQAGCPSCRPTNRVKALKTTKGRQQ